MNCSSYKPKCLPIRRGHQSQTENELKGPLEQFFAEFESTPIASASIGQVHRARLLDGRQVVVKVQHVNIRKTVREDLEVLAGLATLAERIPEIAAWQPRFWLSNFRDP